MRRPSRPAALDALLRKPYLDYALCLLFKRRRITLPRLDPGILWPSFEAAEARVTTLPKGDWSAPTNDLVVLMKATSAIAPRRIVELGSYRGYSAVAMLTHAPAHATLTAVDIDPDHGEAYRGTPLAERVDRRVAAIDRSVFSEDELGSYDLVFVDADHSREAVEHDTAVALELVAPTGTVLWHDYANWGFWTGDCGVPEVLNDLGRSLPVGHLLGSNIAVHKPAWVTQRAPFDDAVEMTRAELRKDHWSSTTARRYA